MARRCNTITGCGPRANWWKQSMGIDWYSSGSSTSTATFRKVQRTNEDITVRLNGLGDFTSFEWNIYNVQTNTLVDTSTERNPTFDPIATPGIYYITFSGSSAVDSISGQITGFFYNHLPKPTELECDIVVDFSSSTTFSYFNAFGGSDNAGLIIGIKGTHDMNNPLSGGYFYPDSLRSASASNKVRIVKLDSTPTYIKNVSGSGSAHAWLMDTLAENIVIDGYLPDSEEHGIFVESAVGSQMVMLRGRISGIHMTGMTFNQTAVGDAGSNITISPLANVTYNAETYLSEDMAFFDLYIQQSNQEGFYLYYNEDDPQDGFVPYKSDGLLIINCVVENSGRDGIQIGSSTNLLVTNNTITNWGTRHDNNHESAISYNAGNTGVVQRNRCIGGEMFINIQSGLYPWNIFDGETTPGDSYFISNIFDHGDYVTGGGVEPYSIYIQNEEDSGAGSFDYVIAHNVIISDKHCAQAYGHPNSFTYTVRLVNNIIVKTGATEIDTAGPGTAPTLVTNNLVRATGSEADIYFTNLSGDNFTISSFDSTAYAGSPTDISALIPAINQYDFLGYPLEVPDEGYTFGAYSGYEKFTVPPVTEATEDWEQGQIQNVTYVGNDATGTGNGGMESLQIIPEEATEWWIECGFEEGGASNPGGMGIIADSSTYGYTFNEIPVLFYFESNTNTSSYESGVFKDFVGAGAGVQSATGRGRIRGSGNDIFTEYSNDDGETWVELYANDASRPAGGIRGVVLLTNGKKMVNLRMYSNVGFE